MKVETLIKKLGCLSTNGKPEECYQKIRSLIEQAPPETQEWVKDLFEPYLDTATALNFVIDTLKKEGLPALKIFASMHPSEEDTLFIKVNNYSLNVVTSWTLDDLIKQLIRRLGGTDYYATILRYIQQLKSIKIPNEGPYDKTFLQIWHLADTYYDELGEVDILAADIMDELFDDYTIEDSIQEYIEDQMAYQGVGCLKDLVKRADMTQKAFRIDSNGNLVTITKAMVEQIKGQFLLALEDSKND